MTALTAAPAVSHDFDFMVGGWNVHNRFLNGRLQGSHLWIEYDETYGLNFCSTASATSITITPYAIRDPWRALRCGSMIRRPAIGRCTGQTTFDPAKSFRR